MLFYANLRRIAAAQSPIARNINFITIVNGSIELICRKKRTGRYDDRHVTSREINSFVLIAPFRRMQIREFRSRSAAFRHRPCVRDVCRSQGRPCGVQLSRITANRNHEKSEHNLRVKLPRVKLSFSSAVKSNLFVEGKSLFQSPRFLVQHINGAAISFFNSFSRGKRSALCLPRRNCLFFFRVNKQHFGSVRLRHGVAGIIETKTDFNY